MKPKTPEQAAQKAEQMKKLRDISATIAKMNEADRTALFAGKLLMTCAGRNLSPFNTCMAISQIQTASVLGGFKQWQAVGRQVKKGAKAIYIWAKSSYKGANESADSTEPSEHGGFFLLPMFDISQTEETN